MTVMNVQRLDALAEMPIPANEGMEKLPLTC
jgi:hypothetical protein